MHNIVDSREKNKNKKMKWWSSCSYCKLNQGNDDPKHLVLNGILDGTTMNGSDQWANMLDLVIEMKLFDVSKSTVNTTYNVENDQNRMDILFVQ